MEYISFTFSFYKMNIAHIKSDNKIFLIIVATSFHWYWGRDIGNIKEKFIYCILWIKK